MKPGRFVVDTHVHGQRHAVRLDKSEIEAGYEDISHVMRTATPADEATEDSDVVVYPNTDRIIHDMDTYGVDRAVLLPGFGMTNEIHKQMVQDHPDRFTALASPVQTDKAAARGEEEWTIERACEELDDVLEAEEFVGIGESAPTDPTRDERIEWRERRDELRQAFEVADAHDVPISWHSGTVSGYSDGKSSLDVYPDWEDPTLVSDLAAEYSDVDIIINHGGMQGTWHEDTVDAACKVAARHNNVYLEIGLYWADLIHKPFNDPNIDLSQLLWGTDWGASMVAHAQPNEEPPMYWDQIESRGLPAHQPDYWGTSLRQLEKFVWDEELPQDEFNLILGGNACRLLDIEPPEKRLFPEYL